MTSRAGDEIYVRDQGEADETERREETAGFGQGAGGRTGGDAPGFRCGGGDAAGTDTAQQQAKPKLAGSRVNDTDCTAFLQWALPRLGLCWLGFRKCAGRSARDSSDAWGSSNSQVSRRTASGSKPTQRSGACSTNVATSPFHDFSATDACSKLCVVMCSPNSRSAPSEKGAPSIFGQPDVAPARSRTR